MRQCKRSLRPVLVGLVAAFILGTTTTTYAGGAPLSFSKVFSPDTIGPGSTSTLTFTITDQTGSPVTALAFTDTLPAGVTIAGAPGAVSSCGGGAILTAPAGGSTITFSDGTLGANSTCLVQVNVTSSTVGTHTNASGALSSSAGTSGVAIDDLMVTTALPGFTKSFSPSSIAFGGRSTLTFTFDNSATGAVDVEFLSFTDNLPAGMLIADPANASTTCQVLPNQPATLTANPGTNVISFASAIGSAFFPILSAGATCNVIVDVIGGAFGDLGNVSESLLVDGGDLPGSGKAAATLKVTGAGDPLVLTKEFTGDPVPPGGTVNLEFTITNRSRNDAATAITFSDDLDAVLPGTPDLTVGTLPSDPCGAGSSLAFAAGVLTLTGGTLASEASCTFSVPLTVPVAAAAGSYSNTTGAVSGSTGTGNMAGDILFVAPIPLLTKEFLDATTLLPDPVVNSGDDVVLRFTVSNTSTTSGATAVAFLDELTDSTGAGGGGTGGFLPFPVTVTLPPVPDPPCGAGSSLALVSLGTKRQGLSLTGGSLAAAPGAGASCSFDVTVTIPETLEPGSYTNTTGEPTATVDGATRTGKPASDSLKVIAAPSLSKAFTDDPVAPGGTVTLEFTLDYSANATDDATGITFTDDLAPVLAGLVATGLPLTEACDPDGPGGSPGTGTLSGTAGDTLLTFAGGALSPGESCTFSVTLQVPAGAATGNFTNTTSDVGATVAGAATTAPAASDQLKVAGFALSKTFSPNPVIPGSEVVLKFTLDNSSGAVAATDITFQDSLNPDVLPGLNVISSPPTPCGGTLSVGPQGGGNVEGLFFSGGSVLAGDTCEFEVTLGVPASTTDATYANATFDTAAKFGGPFVSLPPAIDTLTVDKNFIGLTKSFTDDPVAPGDTVTLKFIVTNLSATNTVTGIAFSDNLDAALSGLMATGVVLNDCGGFADSTFPSGSFQYGGAAGGTLLPGGSCTITLSVDLPPSLPPGSSPPFINTTSALTGMVGALNVTGDPASDELKVQTANLDKAFDGPTAPGGTAVLTFTLKNLSIDPLNDLAFSDDLNAVFTGLTATLPPVPNPPCGPGSMIAGATGTSILNVTGASLAAAGNPGDSCSFSVTVTMPTDPRVCGTLTNTTGDLFASGVKVADPATALLVSVDVLSGAFVQAGGVASIEAENYSNSGGTVGGPWQKLLNQDPTKVSNAAAIKAAPGPNTYKPPGKWVSYQVQLDAGTQDVWVRVQTFNNLANSIYFQFDTGPIQTFRLGDDDHNRWRWVKLPTPIIVPSPDGELHTITIHRREGLTEVDKIVITRDDKFVPKGLGPKESARLTTCLDTDGDGDPDVTDPDDDNDGIPDDVEIANGTDPLNPNDAGLDPDNDGLTNLEEFQKGTDPNNPDTDGDGIGDAFDDLPTVGSNGCTGGNPDNRIFNALVNTVRTCAARVSIDVISPDTVVVDPGHLTLVAPTVTFGNGFIAGWLTVISNDGCPSCNNSVAPSVSATNPLDGAINVPIDSNVDITFNKPVTVAGNWFQMICGGIDITASVAVTDTDPVFTLNPLSDLGNEEFCTVTVFAANVTDDDTIDPPDNMAGNFSFSFTTVPELDFGDAPDSYSTLLASDGARHVLSATPTDFLGSVGDGETDGQPTPDADGDDLNGTDDEDGVTLPTLVKGTTATVGITANTAGKINAWVDFNRSGTWESPAEQVLTDSPVLSTGFFTVTFDVPPDAAIGDTYARFRMDTAGGLLPTGQAPDGEVEDYKVEIIAASADLAITKTDSPDPVLPGGTLTYTVEVTNNGPNDAADVVVTDTLPTGLQLLTTNGCAEDPVGVPTCTLGTIANGASDSYTIDVSVAGGVSGTLTNNASVSSSTADPDAGDNSASEDTSVTFQNDAPSFAKGADENVLEDAGAQTVPGWATAISAGPPDESGQALTFNLTTTGTTGNLTFSSVPAVSSTGELTYTPDADTNGSATIEIVLMDDGGIADGGADTSAPQTFTIAVEAVNDEPSFTKGADESVSASAGAQTVNAWATAISAGPADESGQTLTFNVTNNTDTSLFTAGGQPAVSSTGELTYTPESGSLGGTATISVELMDDGGTANGGDDTSPTQDFDITVSLNAAPTATNLTQTKTYTEGDATFALDDIVVSDADIFPVQTITATLTLANTATGVLTAASGNGETYTPGTGVWTVTGTLADVNAALAAVSFTPETDNDVDTTITTHVEDQDGDGPADGTITLDVTPVNDAPTLANIEATALTYTENDPAIQITNTITVQDIDDTNIELAMIQVTTNHVSGEDVLGTNGSVPAGITVGAFNNASGSIALSGSATLADYQTALRAITYATSSEDPNPAKAVTFSVIDGTAQSNFMTRNITVTPVNDAPTIAINIGVTVNEGGMVSITGTQLDEGDPDDSGTGLTYTATSGPTNGQLELTTAPGIAISSFSQDDLDNNRVKYIHNGGEMISDSFTFSLADGGEDGSTPATGTFNITVTPVNDAPTLGTISNPAAIPENAPEQTVNISGIGAGGGETQVLTVTATSDTIGLIPNPTVTYTSPNATGTLKYTPVPSQSGSAIITVKVMDDGGTLNGGVDMTTEMFTVSVTPATPPTDAIDDSYTGIIGNVGLNVPAGNGVLSNDTSATAVSKVQTSALNIGVAVATTSGNGTVTVQANGSFVYEPNAGNITADSFTYEANGVDTATVNLAFGSNLIWFIDSSTSSAGNVGTLSDPFNSIAGYNGVNAAGDKVFIAAGSYTGPLSLDSNTVVIGEGAIGTTAGLLGVTTEPTDSRTLPSVGGTDPVITSAGSDGISLASDNTVRGLSIGNSSGVGIDDNGSLGTLNMSDVTISTTSGAGLRLDSGGTVNLTGTNSATTTTGTAVNITNTTIGGLGVTFESISSDGGSVPGIILDDTGSGTFTVTGSGTTDGSGGTIENIVGADAITLNNTDGRVTFKNMIIEDISASGDAADGLDTRTGVDGIHGEQVDGGLTLDNVTMRRFSDNAINGATFGGTFPGLGATTWNGLEIRNSTIEDSNRYHVTSPAPGKGDSSDEGLIRIVGLKGTVVVDNSTLQRGGELMDLFTDTAGNLDMTVQRSFFIDSIKEFVCSGGTVNTGKSGIDVTFMGADGVVRIGDPAETNAALGNRFTNNATGSLRIGHSGPSTTGDVDVVISQNIFEVTDHLTGPAGCPGGTFTFNFPQGGVSLRPFGPSTMEAIVSNNLFDQAMNADGGLGQLSLIGDVGSTSEFIVRGNEFKLPWQGSIELRADATTSMQVKFGGGADKNTWTDGMVGSAADDVGFATPSPYLPFQVNVRDGGSLDLTIDDEILPQHDDASVGLHGFSESFVASINSSGGTLNLGITDSVSPDGYKLLRSGGTFNLFSTTGCGGSPTPATIIDNNNNTGGSNSDATDPPIVVPTGTITCTTTAPTLPVISIP